MIASRPVCERVTVGSLHLLRFAGSTKFLNFEHHRLCAKKGQWDETAEHVVDVLPKTRVPQRSKGEKMSTWFSRTGMWKTLSRRCFFFSKRAVCDFFFCKQQAACILQIHHTAKSARSTLSVCEWKCLARRDGLSTASNYHCCGHGYV